jgi:hypothetical protein
MALEREVLLDEPEVRQEGPRSPGIKPHTRDSRVGEVTASAALRYRETRS